MPTEHPIRSFLITVLLLGMGASALNNMARADIFLSTGPDGEEHFSDQPPLDGPAILVATSGTKPGRNAAAPAPTAPQTSSAMASASFDAIAGSEDHSPPAQAEPFTTDGPIAAGKSFTAGD